MFKECLYSGFFVLQAGWVSMCFVYSIILCWPLLWFDLLR